MSNDPPPTAQYATPGGYVPFATPVPPRPKIVRSLVGWAIFIGLAVMLFVFLKRDQGSAYDLPLDAFAAELSNGNLRSIFIEGDELGGQFVNPPAYTSGASRYRTVLPPGMAGQWSFV